MHLHDLSLSHLFGANRGPRPFADGLVSVDGLASLTKMKTIWVIKYLNIILPTNDVYKKDADLCVDSPPTLRFTI